MNKKIDDLAYWAGLYADGTPDSWDSEALEKFARSLVEDICREIREKSFVLRDVDFAPLYIKHLKVSYDC